MTDRVTVTFSCARRRARRRKPSDEATDPGAAQVRSLIRTQARLALTSTAIVFVLLTGLPLLFALAPGLSHVRLMGVRLPWVILCGGVQPIWVMAARRHVRLAERAERAFTDPARRG
ncbi:hypothetical protein [Actinomadura sp. DC4]|uniref:hypothetical protein n=1 Tax=Actinomadura sp. DC4 TaxID=3055069 RepID=UPI0025AF6A6B|nr:hypothetical protein [Actinomadura sp. DC4]MDN3358438.1 hypothetical protein [Actinomadura sp. DC4]